MNFIRTNTHSPTIRADARHLYRRTAVRLYESTHAQHLCRRTAVRLYESTHAQHLYRRTAVRLYDIPLIVNKRAARLF